MDKQKIITHTIIGMALYLIATGSSYAVFTYIIPHKNVNVAEVPVNPDQDQSEIDPSIPRTEECPLNGKMYTDMERQLWEKRRPLAVMIENHEESRPQSGVSRADVVYEAVAEGGITRFMAVFYCGVYQDTLIAPVRSARTYYLPWVLEYDALYNHVGGAGLCHDPTVDERAKALCQVQQYKIKDMDQFGISFPTCYRNYDRLDHPVATEHTMVCSTEKLYNVASERGWSNVDAKGVAWDKNFKSWKFIDDAKVAERGASFSASFTAWEGYANSYGVSWQYDPATNSYKRKNGGVPHLDLETDRQIGAKNVVILFAKETGPVDEHKHLLYTNIGTGEAIVFQNGVVLEGTWRKTDRSARTIFYDTKGREIPFVRGQIWIEMLPIGTTVDY
ncbi:hypothetical protein A2154_05220 [Candidatus Gottesmanbacteria bacterium RBG_16_43_7]|uniref:DUF3048 domain-containing protein n=1 Tax=Candidatus Gottesmanbacteria bacterium RBG_16_43_7 TaxID=1798373 RepID=A0A1F5Z955_9BACT|nr:MAG: hypothetical protein A2154_05220 [Candidatus Gottesmanbacteria bacterium RBG_16_43_7]